MDPRELASLLIEGIRIDPFHNSVARGHNKQIDYGRTPYGVGVWNVILERNQFEDESSFLKVESLLCRTLKKTENFERPDGNRDRTKYKNRNFMAYMNNPKTSHHKSLHNNNTRLTREEQDKLFEERICYTVLLNAIKRNTMPVVENGKAWSNLQGHQEDDMELYDVTDESREGLRQGIQEIDNIISGREQQTNENGEIVMITSEQNFLEENKLVSKIITEEGNNRTKTLEYLASAAILKELKKNPETEKEMRSKLPLSPGDLRTLKYHEWSDEAEKYALPESSNMSIDTIKEAIEKNLSKEEGRDSGARSR
jgi:hypothetical protein